MCALVGMITLSPSAACQDVSLTAGQQDCCVLDPMDLMRTTALAALERLHGVSWQRDINGCAVDRSQIRAGV
jgi:hypothetical protein